ncbi:MAG: hypothetical protein U9N72_01380 [Bacteroidota bacterium]|nr:hypothetical protein [Bacteroidota bacterium]
MQKLKSFERIAATSDDPTDDAYVAAKNELIPLLQEIYGLASSDVRAKIAAVEAVYKSYPHYENSFELGVIYNNRAAALITISLFRDSIRADYNPLFNTSSDSIMNMAESNIRKAISIYNNWIKNLAVKAGKI